MAHDRVTQAVPAPARKVFDLVHDYPRRLEWDTLPSAAYLDEGHTEAKKGATSGCVGKLYLGRLALKTVYVVFDRPAVAAVKMVNRPPFLDPWAASLRHEDTGDDSSRITYTFHFTARPEVPSSVLDPLTGAIFEGEVRKGPRALKHHFGPTVYPK